MPGLNARAQAYLEDTRRWLSPDGPIADGPASDGPASDGPGSDGRAPHPGPRPARKGDRRPVVLVVDDNADMRRYVGGLLSSTYEVVVAAHGGEALDQIRRRRPDVVVSDVMMPVLDGMGLLAAIRADAELADLPFLMLSARAGPEATLDGLGQGADDYLVKPFSARELSARVGALVQSSRRRSAVPLSERRHQEWVAALADVAAALNTATEFDEVASAVYGALAARGGLATAIVGLVNREAGTVDQFFGNPHVPPSIVGRYRRLALDGETAPARVVREGTPVFLGRLEDLRASHPTAVDDDAQLGAQSLATMPFVAADGQIFGALTLLWDHPVDFDAEHLHDLLEVAEVVSRAVERVRTRLLEREMTRDLQLGLLALNVRSTSAVIRANYRSADPSFQIGGDWYDAMALDGGRLGVAVGDVVGRGMPAATAMGQLRAALGTAASIADDPAEALSIVDRFAAHLPGARCATAFYAVVDPVRAEVAYSRAGHLPPLLARPDGAVEVLDDGGSWPLGLHLPDARPPATTRPFPPGSLLVCYTDGLVERRSESLDVGIERLRRVVAEGWMLPLSELKADIWDRALATGPQRDDVAMIALRTPAVTPTMFVEVIPADAAILRATRQRFSAWLEGQGLSPAARDDCVLALGEAGANAIEHGSENRRSQVVSIEAARHEDQLVLAVSDSGTWKAGLEGFLAGRGHGHVIMQATSDRLDIHHDHRGTVVTLRFALGAR